MSNYADITNWYNAVQTARSRVFRDDPEVQEAIDLTVKALQRLVAEQECSIARHEISAAKQTIEVNEAVILSHGKTVDA